MIKHFQPILAPRTSCGIPPVDAYIPGYNPVGPRVTPEEVTTARVDVTCADCKRKMGGVNVGKIRLTPAQVGVMLYLAGRWTESARYPKAKQTSDDRLTTVGLIERSDIWPYRKLTGDGRQWLHVNHPS